MGNLMPIDPSRLRLAEAGRIENRIFLIRGQKVMLDRDLAELYGVETFNFNKAVKRNLSRFPEDFMFQLTQEENRSLRFQFGMLKRGQHSKYLPYVFTEQGVAMLSSVLKENRRRRSGLLPGRPEADVSSVQGRNLRP